MALRLMPKNEMRADERLSRLDQQVEEFVQSPEHPLESLIVMGASAGGHRAIQEAVKDLSHDLPGSGDYPAPFGHQNRLGISVREHPQPVH